MNKHKSVCVFLLLFLVQSQRCCFKFQIQSSTIEIRKNLFLKPLKAKRAKNLKTNLWFDPDDGSWKKLIVRSNNLRWILERGTVHSKQMNLWTHLASNDVFCLEGTTFIEFCSILKIIDFLCQCLVLEDVVYWGRSTTSISFFLSLYV